MRVEKREGFSRFSDAGVASVLVVLCAVFIDFTFFVVPARRSEHGVSIGGANIFNAEISNNNCCHFFLMKRGGYDGGRLRATVLSPDFVEFKWDAEEGGGAYFAARSLVPGAEGYFSGSRYRFPGQSTEA